MSSTQWKTEQARLEAWKDECIKNGWEILTPKGAAYLFGKSDETIRAARRAERDKAVVFFLTIENRGIPMLRFEWAAAKWAKDLDQDRLAEMRKNGWTLGSNLVLHDRPIVDVDEWGRGTKGEQP